MAVADSESLEDAGLGLTLLCLPCAVANSGQLVAGVENGSLAARHVGGDFYFGGDGGGAGRERFVWSLMK